MKIAFKMKTYNILSIDEFKTNIGNNSRLLGIDPGNKNIGFAICDENKKVATPYKIIKKGKFAILLDEINLLIKENNIKGIVIGNPINMDGSLGRSAQSIKDTSQNIEKNINIPVCLWDERLSTVGAFTLSSQLDINISKRQKKIDENAATFILQGAIDFLNN